MIQNNNHDKVWITKQKDHIDFELKRRKSDDDLPTTLCKYYWLLAAGCLQFSFPYFHLQMLCVLFGQLMFQKWMGTNCETNDKNHARTHRVGEFVCSLWKIRFFNYVASFMRCTDLFMICTVIVLVVFQRNFLITFIHLAMHPIRNSSWTIFTQSQAQLKRVCFVAFVIALPSIALFVS